MRYADPQHIPGNRQGDPPRLPAPPVQKEYRPPRAALRTGNNPNHKPGRITCLTCPTVFDSWCVKKNRMCPGCHVVRAGNTGYIRKGERLE